MKFNGHSSPSDNTLILCLPGQHRTSCDASHQWDSQAATTSHRAFPRRPMAMMQRRCYDNACQHSSMTSQWAEA